MKARKSFKRDERLIIAALDGDHFSGWHPKAQELRFELPSSDPGEHIH